MKETKIKLIEDFIDGKLSGKDLDSFKKELSTDKELLKLYEDRIKISELWVKSHEYQSLKSEIGDIIKQENKTFGSRYFFHIGIAATVLVLISIYFIFFNSSSNKLFDNNTVTSVYDTTINNEEEISFRFDEPAEYASIDSLPYFINLVSPVNGEKFDRFETIKFSWKSNSMRSDTLFIVDSESQNILLKLFIVLSDTMISIQYPQFEEREYIWYISDSNSYGRFHITENIK